MTSFQDVSLLDEQTVENDSKNDNIESLTNNENNKNNNKNNNNNNNNNDINGRVIKITSVEDRKGRLSKYSVYIIECEPAFPGVINVARRYNDFKWLRQTLCKQFPGVFVPPLPPAKLLGRFEESFVEERKIDLERFLYRINKNFAFRDTLTFEMFLSRPETTFVEGKKYIEETINLDNSYLLKKLQELYPSINEIDIVSTVHKEDIPKLKLFLTKIDAQMKELNNISNKLLNDMKSVSSEMNNFSNAFSGLYECENNYPYKPKSTGNRIDLREQFKEFDDFHNSQSHAFYLHFIRQLRYEHEDIQAFLELFIQRDKIFNLYQKNENIVIKYTNKINNGQSLTPEEEKKKLYYVSQRDLLFDLYNLITKIMLKSQINFIWDLRTNTWRQQVFKFSKIQTQVTSKMLMKWKNINE